MAVGVLFAGQQAVAAKERPPTLVVHLVDYAKLAASARQEAVREASRIYAAAGVRLAWIDGFDGWRVSDGRLHIALVILDRKMGLRQLAADALGEQVLAEAVRPTRRAYIFSHRIADRLANDPGRLGTAVGVVAAHEIGHLVLPADSHAASGVMQASGLLNLIVPQRFRDDQAAAIRSAVATAPPAWSTPEHVRSADHSLLALMDAGIMRSTTLRDLVARLNASDVVVYIKRGLRLRSGLAGYLDHGIVAAGPFRYMTIVVDGGLGTDRLIGVIAHELQHAAEIAEASEARSAAAVDALFRHLDSGKCVRLSTCMETDAAVRVQESVAGDLQGR